jgi:glutamine amidotransferase
MTTLHLCDYGSGNVYNVERALGRAGAVVVRCTRPEELRDAAAVVIPGVGAFGDCIAALRERGFEQPVRRLCESGAWVLGICVGMQILGTRSEEFGIHEGLNIISGTVQQIAGQTTEGEPLKRPHIGWSGLRPAAAWAGSPLGTLPAGTAMYFLHSFHLVPDASEHLLAVTEYGGHDVVAAVRRGRVFGVQFHPEKSGPAGLALLREFVRLSGAAPAQAA